MRKTVISFAPIALFSALCASAQAQQPTKIPRIGYQSASSSGENNEEAFRQGLRELATLKDGTSSSSGDLRKESPIRSPKTRLSWSVSRLTLSLQAAWRTRAQPKKRRQRSP